MKKEFDLIVIGTGSGGSTAAQKCSEEGWTVAVIDSNPFGGTCALRGCDPKKVLVGASEIVDRQKRMKDKGITGNILIKWSELMKFKSSFTDPVPLAREKNYEQNSIKYFRGRSKFLDPKTIEVNGEQLSGKHFLLANGAKPVRLNIKGEEHLTYSSQFLELPDMPKQIIFIGGGYISFEFAHLSARSGSEVTIIHNGTRPLEKFDADLVGELLKATRELGINIILENEVTEIIKVNEKLNVQFKNKTEIKSLSVDMVVHGAGRVPDIDDLNAESANVKLNEGGIELNEFLQSTSNPRVYAAGDVAAAKGLPLTPVAAMDSKVVTTNLLNGNHIKPDYNVIPTVVFTIPILASVGISEEDAINKGIKFRKSFALTSNWYSSKRIGENHSGYKILIEEDSNKIIGAHLLGHNSDEVINIFALAIKYNITASQLKSSIYSYPTRSSDITYML
jgi:glutathione reductase (NADPH)